MIEQPVQSNFPTSEERTLAGLSHIFGSIFALVIWLMQKDRSRYVRFQSAQALAFDITVMIVMFLIVGLMFGCTFAGMAISFARVAVAIPPAVESSDDATAVIPIFLAMIPMFLPFGFVLCLLPLSVGIFVGRIVAAINAFTGKDFHYPWLGKQVERILAD